MSDLIFLSFDSKKADINLLAQELDEALHIENWFTVFNNALLLETTASPKEVSDTLQGLHTGLNLICIKFDANDAFGLLPMAIGREIANRKNNA